MERLRFRRRELFFGGPSSVNRQDSKILVRKRIILILLPNPLDFQKLAPLSLDSLIIGTDSLDWLAKGKPLTKGSYQVDSSYSVIASLGAQPALRASRGSTAKARDSPRLQRASSGSVPSKGTEPGIADDRHRLVDLHVSAIILVAFRMDEG